MVDEEIMNEMGTGDRDPDVYTEEGREKLMEEGEITDVDEGVARGFEQGQKMVRCMQCGKELPSEDFVEIEIEGDMCRFCSDECAEKYKKSLK